MNRLCRIQLLLLVAGALAATTSQASEIQPFLGNWESNSYNCTVDVAKRNTGEYLSIERDGSKQEGVLYHGSYETEGGSCKFRNARTQNDRVIVDAMCREEEFDPSPTQLEFSLVYDAKHMAFRDLRHGSVQFFTLCNRKSQEEHFRFEESASTSPNPFWWLPNDYCTRFYEPSAEYVASGQCRRQVESCMSKDGGEGDCPKFARCEYWSKGKLVSSGRCGSVFKVGALGSTTSWLWQSGNMVNISYQVSSGHYRWNKQRVTHSVRTDGAECYALRRSQEVFCSVPYAGEIAN